MTMQLFVAIPDIQVDHTQDDRFREYLNSNAHRDNSYSQQPLELATIESVVHLIARSN